ncbi:hypothetical protein DFH06DRAFT_314736 [Mycena polygramma]|nr:hypothetical protein DFH06DRAFT_314736 [Mycena polygramma]
MSIRFDGLWFSGDTQVVLRAGDAVFCVSKSILAGRSTVFQSMFEIPQPAVDSGDEMIDGMPVIHLHDDASAVEPFLRAIFDSSYFMPPPAKTDLDAALGILRLSHKYHIPYLFQRAILHLETLYPIDLPAYHSLAGDKKNAGPAQDLELIAIFQQVDATWLLPFAFYSVGRYSADRLSKLGDSWDNLSPETKQTCLAVLATHIRETLKVQVLLSAPSTCSERRRCNSSKFACLRDSLTDQLSELEGGLQEPLEQRSAGDWNSLKSQVCDNCFRSAQADYKHAQKNIWDQLPANCGIADWDVLMEQRRVAMA